MTLRLITRESKRNLAWDIANDLIKEYRFITTNDTLETYVYEDGIYSTMDADSLILSKITECLEDRATTHVLKEVKNHIKGLTIVNREAFNANLGEICVKNGILCLLTGKLEAHTPDKVFFSKIPLIYDPLAGCPTITKFMHEILPEADYSNIIELFGYCLYRSYPIHKAFMFVGDGANGKSTLINLLKAFLGNNNCSSVSLQDFEKKQFALAALNNKLANLYSDLSHNSLYATGKFKMLTGEDTTTCERKFKDPFEMTNYAKLIFSCNRIPANENDDTIAFWRRWIIINFPNQFLGNNADKNLMIKITAEPELSGLLNLAIAGLQELLVRGEFFNNKVADDVRERYIKLSDSVKAFGIDKIETDADAVIVKKELLAAYFQYCREQNVPAISEKTFFQRIYKYYNIVDIRLPDVGRERAVRGIRIKDENNDVKTLSTTMSKISPYLY